MDSPGRSVCAARSWQQRAVFPQDLHGVRGCRRALPLGFWAVSSLPGLSLQILTKQQALTAFLRMGNVRDTTGLWG